MTAGAGGAARRLPSPGVRFADDFVRRLERLRAECRGRAARWDGLGRGSAAGRGNEFVGYRPYRPGEDVRQLDWNLYGRLDRPFVRVTRREASERWVVLVDTSASMGVGRPGKLQWAAEVAAAVASLGLVAGASVRVRTSRAERPEFTVRRPSHLWGLLDFLGGARAEGARGAEALLDAAVLRGGDRVVALGDWLGADPARLRGALAPGRDVALGCVLADEEIGHFPAEPIEWWDPESQEHRLVDVDAEARAAYERLLEEELDRWRTTCARHRVRYGFWTSGAPFEDVAPYLLDA